MTDRIISRFYRLPAPSFLTLSATLHLPLAAPFAVTPDDALSKQRLLRDLQFNSDRHLSLGMNATADALIAEKRQLIAEQHRAAAERPSHENHQRYRKFQEIAQRLTVFTTDQRSQAEDNLQEIHRQLAANTVLNNREFAFCLYPVGKLREFMTSLPVDG